VPKAQTNESRGGGIILIIHPLEKSILQLQYFVEIKSTTPPPMSDRFAHLFGATPPVQEGSLLYKFYILN
jgi:hypothetical protein